MKHLFYIYGEYFKESRLVYQEAERGNSAKKQEVAPKSIFEDNKFEDTKEYKKIEPIKQQLKKLKNRVRLPAEIRPVREKHSGVDADNMRESTRHVNYMNTTLETIEIPDVLNERAERMEVAQEILYRHYLDPAFIWYLSEEPGLLAKVDDALEKAIKYPDDLEYDHKELPGYIVIRKSSESELSGSELPDDFRIVVDPGQAGTNKIEGFQGMVTEVGTDNLLDIGGQLPKTGQPWPKLDTFRYEFQNHFVHFMEDLQKGLNEGKTKREIFDRMDPNSRRIFEICMLSLPYRTKKMIEDLRNTQGNIDNKTHEKYLLFLHKLKGLDEGAPHPANLYEWNNGGVISIALGYDEEHPSDIFFFTLPRGINSSNTKIQPNDWVQISFSPEGYLMDYDENSKTWRVNESYYNTKDLPIERRDIVGVADLIKTLQQNAEKETDTRKKLLIQEDIKQATIYFRSRFSIDYSDYDPDNPPSDTKGKDVDPVPIKTLSLKPHPVRDRFFAAQEKSGEEEPKSAEAEEKVPPAPKIITNGIDSDHYNENEGKYYLKDTAKVNINQVFNPGLISEITLKTGETERQGIAAGTEVTAVWDGKNFVIKTEGGSNERLKIYDGDEIVETKGAEVTKEGVISQISGIKKTELYNFGVKLIEALWPEGTDKLLEISQVHNKPKRLKQAIIGWITDDNFKQVYKILNSNT